MIEKISGVKLPNADYKAIKISAYATVNLLKGNRNSVAADMAYKKFLAEGKKAPGYASTVMKVAQNDSFVLDTKRMLNIDIKSDEFKGRSNNLCNGLSDLALKNSEAKTVFEEAGEKLYPKTWKIRKNSILPFFRDNSNDSYPTSHMKTFKKNFDKNA